MARVAVRRTGHRFAPDVRRVIARPYLPGEEIAPGGDSRASLLMRRVVQIGNCGSPLETAAGWLVLTHGVGAMRRYSIGALLLDLEDPGRVLGRLRCPLLEPDDVEREGYVPNVVYSCGGLIRGDELVLPYGQSDGAVGVAMISVPELLAALRASP